MHGGHQRKDQWLQLLFLCPRIVFTSFQRYCIANAPILLINWTTVLVQIIFMSMMRKAIFHLCASKIKLKSVNKKRMATARRLFFWIFSRRPLLIWLHCCFHHYKTLKAVATETAVIVLLTPANFYYFQRRKFNFQLLSFTFEIFGKNLQKQISLLGSMWRKSKQKKDKRLFNRLRCSDNDFLPKFVNNSESLRFFGRCWGCRAMLWVNISS
jgi:hypothetical protein